MAFTKTLTLVLLVCIYGFTHKLLAQVDQKDSLQQVYQSYLELVENGKPAPVFKYIDIHGDSVSLEDFKGSVIVLDFWATWCKPCIAQMPEFEKLKERFTGEDIQFISISADTDIEKWRNFLKEKDWKDIQLFAGGLKDKPQLYYTLDYMPVALKGTDARPLVTRIPRYVIIDKNLNIHNNKAPKPYSSEMDAILKELLN